MTGQRLTGSFYTCNTVADYLVNWAICDRDDSLLEPSFGDGVFIDSAMTKLFSMGNDIPQIYAVELQQEPFLQYTNKNQKVHGYCQDFMLFKEPVLVNSVIGNPPYIRLKNLSSVERQTAIDVVKEHGVTMQTSGSLWMPFIIHATDFLKIGGRLGFVLPFEVTYVKYAYPLWNYLRNKFGKIRIFRIHEDIFPDVDVETILFLAEDYGQATNNVEYCLFQDKEGLFSGQWKRQEIILIDDILSGNKPFVWGLLSNKQRTFIQRLREKKDIVCISNFCKFKIGYVCADKTFFHPNLTVVNKYGLSNKNLLPCISNSKDINGGTGIGVTIENGQCSAKLYIPQVLDEADKQYIQHGVTLRVHERYKCKIRKPWYITPNIERADLILTVFGDVPKLIANKGEYAVSNSLLSGGLTGNISSEEVVCRWYNSLTLLSAELNVHSLGGGVLVFIPGETDKVEVLNKFPKEKVPEIVERLNESVLNYGLSATYALGDEIVLKGILGFTDEDIFIVRSALKELQYWRRPDNRRSKR